MTTTEPLSVSSPLPCKPVHGNSDDFNDVQSPASYAIPRGPVTAFLSFYKPPPDNSPPYNYVETPPPGVPQRNFSDHNTPIELSDIRGREAEFTLDNSAFAALTDMPSNATIDFTDDEQVKKAYYPEVEALVLSHVPGAHRVLVFDHTIRRSESNAHRAPVTRVHIDQTPSSALSRLHLHLPASEASVLSHTRYRIINVWRALNPPVYNPPLAFAASATVPDSDIVAVQHRYPDRVGETAGVLHSPGQRWYYWSGMRAGDVLLLECFDSGDRTGRVPHTAFEDPRTPPGAPQRDSIEVRTLVFG